MCGPRFKDSAVSSHQSIPARCPGGEVSFSIHGDSAGTHPRRPAGPGSLRRIAQERGNKEHLYRRLLFLCADNVTRWRGSSYNRGSHTGWSAIFIGSSYDSKHSHSGQRSALEGAPGNSGHYGERQPSAVPAHTAIILLQPGRGLLAFPCARRSVAILTFQAQAY